MKMIKKAKISGAGLSLPIHSQGLLSFREGEAKKPSSRAHSGSVLHPACLSCCLCCCGRLSSPSNRAAPCSPRRLSCSLFVAVQLGRLHHGLLCLQEFLLELRGLDPPKHICGKWNFWFGFNCLRQLEATYRVRVFFGFCIFLQLVNGKVNSISVSILLIQTDMTYVGPFLNNIHLCIHLYCIYVRQFDICGI